MEKRKHLKDLQCQHRGNLGVVRMNREHRHNILTPNFTKQIKRGVDTMYHDHNVELIYLTTPKGQHFSNGTDFRTLLHYQANNETDKLVEYLGDIFQLQASFAKMNKPIMSIAPGNSFNSGAGLLAATGAPFVTDTSIMAFNEVQFGFVPHAGSSYYMSRLPDDIGTFLQLTGFPITGKDAINLGLADCFLNSTKDHEYVMHENIFSLDTSAKLTAAQVNAQDAGGMHSYSNVNEHATNVMEQIDGTQKSQINELRARGGINVNQEDFVNPNERIPDMVVDADIEYENILRRHSEARHGHGGMGYFDHKPNVGYNFFKETVDWVKSFEGDVYEGNAVQTVLKHKQMISRCFYHDSVEEILDTLKREQDPFAQKIHDRMNKNSMLSMKIALKMLRKAQNMDYGQVLRMELNASLNKVKDSDFEYGVSKVLLQKNSNNIEKPLFKRKNISNAQVDSYLQENPLSQRIDMDIVENCLLPTKHYFERYADSLRTYINETNTPMEQIRAAVDIETHEILRSHGINTHDKTFTIPQAREVIYKQHRVEKYWDEYVKRSTKLSHDKILRERYHEKVTYELLKLEENEDKFYQLVNESIHNQFEDSYFDRLGKMTSASENANNLEKRRMFLRIKKLMITQRMMEFPEEYFNKLITRIENMPYKMPHLTEGFTQNMRQVEHPEIQQSTMWHLSKVIGKQSLAPESMMKTYLTDPEAAKELSTYVFDHNQLGKIQKDLLQNPEKYEELLNKELEADPWLSQEDYGQYWDQKHKRYNNTEQRFAFYNDGRSRKNNMEVMDWPWRTEYMLYKDWVENIRGNSLNSLQLIVSKLINEKESIGDINHHVDKFQRNNKESKRSALLRLHEMLNLEGMVHKEKAASKTQQDKEITLETQLNDFICSDPVLKKLFGLDQNNMLTTRFKNELMTDLTQLLNIVLLDKSGDELLNGSRYEDNFEKLFKYRQVNSEDKDEKLTMIDDYLATRKGQRSIKRALQVVKPYFFQVMQNRINEESDKLLTGFRKQENKFDVLNYFLSHKMVPDIYTSDLMTRIGEYNPTETAEKIRDRQYPTQSRSQKFKDLLATVRLDEQSEDMGLQDKCKNLTEQALVQMKKAYYLETQGADSVKEFENHIQRKHNERLSPAYNEGDTAKRLEEVLFNEDLPELALIQNSIKDISDFTLNHKHEIETTISVRDWLEVYSKSIDEYDMDMEFAIKNNRNTEDYMDEFQEHGSQLNILNKNYQTEDKKMNWKDFAEYSRFLQGLHDEASSMSTDQDSNIQYNRMVQFLNIDNGNEDSDLYFTRQQLLGSIEPHFNRNSKFISELDSLSELREAVNRRNKDKLAILKMSQHAPESTQHKIEDLVKLDSSYVRLDKLKAYLQNKEYRGQEFDQNQFIDSDTMVIDITSRSDKTLRIALEHLNDYKLDVVSILEMKQLINEQLPELINKQMPAMICKVEDKKYYQQQGPEATQTQSESESEDEVEQLKPEDLQEGAGSDTEIEPKEEQLNEEIMDYIEDTDYSGLSSAEDEAIPEKFKDKYGREDVPEDVQEDVPEQPVPEGQYQVERLIVIQQELESLIDLVSSQLQYVSNERRSQMTLGEFLAKYHHQSSSSLRQYSDDLLKQVIENRLGKVQKTAGSTLTEGDSAHPASGFVGLNDISLTDAATEVWLDGTVVSAEGATIQKKVYREARVALELSAEMQLVLNGTENALLQEYSRGELQEGQVETIVNKYAQIRINDAMLKPSFARGVQSENRELYTKLLREAIVDELKLTSSLTQRELLDEANHFAWGSAQGADAIRLQAESYYNLDGFSNEEAIGFRNIKERLANPDDNRDLAHESVFDKLLAEYYLQKRQDVKSGNSLLKQLEGEFSKASGRHPGVKTAEGNPEKTLGEHYLRQTSEKEDLPMLPSHNLPELMELDMSINRHLNENMGALATQARGLLAEESDIPEYYEANDVRKPADKYVADRLRHIIVELFESRRQLEKHMSRQELLAYDTVLANFLRYENLMPKLRSQVNKDFNALDQQNQQVDHALDGRRSEARQGLKTRNRQPTHNAGVQDEDAYFKFLAFGSNLERKRRENLDVVRKDLKISAGFESFEMFYLDNLEERSKLEPTAIDKVALRPKSRIELEALGDFQDQRGRQEQFFLDHKLYKEGKLEQQERTQLYYVLEKLKEQAEGSTDDQKLRAAGGHLKAYFSDPKNTHFFEQNKLR